MIERIGKFRGNMPTLTTAFLRARNFYQEHHFPAKIRRLNSMKMINGNALRYTASILMRRRLELIRVGGH